jgi:hypothetical protein
VTITAIGTTLEGSAKAIVGDLSPNLAVEI